MPVYAVGRNEDGQLGVGSVADVLVPAVVSSLIGHRIVEVATGSGHTVFLTADGAVFSCGRGDDGRLGHGDFSWKNTPQRIESFGSTRLRHIACGSYHTAAVSADGRLFTFGGGLYSKLGHAGEECCPIPRPVSGLAGKTVLMVACGSRHTLALVTSPDFSRGAQVFAFGATDHGVCGIGMVPTGTTSTSTAPGSDHPARAFTAAPTLVKALDGADVQAIAACGFHSLALAGDGTVFSWGEGQFGRLGHGGEATEWSPKRIAPSLLSDVVAVSAGGFHSAALTALGEVYTWGGGEHGATGHGSTANHTIPVRVEALLRHTIVSVACGWSHTLFLSAEGVTWTSGNNEHGKGGTGDPGRQLLPTRVSSLSGMCVTAFSAYNEHSVFLTQPDGPNALDVFGSAIINSSSSNSSSSSNANGGAQHTTPPVTPQAYHHYWHTRKTPGVSGVAHVVGGRGSGTPVRQQLIGHDGGTSAAALAVAGVRRSRGSSMGGSSEGGLGAEIELDMDEEDAGGEGVAAAAAAIEPDDAEGATTGASSRDVAVGSVSTTGATASSSSQLHSEQQPQQRGPTPSSGGSGGGVISHSASRRGSVPLKIRTSIGLTPALEPRNSSGGRGGVDAPELYPRSPAVIVTPASSSSTPYAVTRPLDPAMPMTPLTSSVFSSSVRDVRGSSSSPHVVRQMALTPTGLQLHATVLMSGNSGLYNGTRGSSGFSEGRRLFSQQQQQPRYLGGSAAAAVLGRSASTGGFGGNSVHPASLLTPVAGSVGGRDSPSSHPASSLVPPGLTLDLAPRVLPIASGSNNSSSSPLSSPGPSSAASTSAALYPASLCLTPGVAGVLGASVTTPMSASAVAHLQSSYAQTAAQQQLLQSVLLSPSARRSTSRGVPITVGYLHEMASLVNNRAAFPDVTLLVEGEQIVAHRAILATRCPTFRAMFSSALSAHADGCYEVGGINAGTFLSVLHFCYTDQLHVPAEDDGLLLCQCSVDADYRAANGMSDEITGTAGDCDELCASGSVAAVASSSGASDNDATAAAVLLQHAPGCPCDPANAALTASASGRTVSVPQPLGQSTAQQQHLGLSQLQLQQQHSQQQKTLQRACVQRARQLIALYAAADMLNIDRLLALCTRRIIAECTTSAESASFSSSGGSSSGGSAAAAAAASAAVSTGTVFAIAALAAMERHHVTQGEVRRHVMNHIASRVSEASATCEFKCQLSRETIVELVGLARDLSAAANRAATSATSSGTTQQ